MFSIGSGRRCLDRQGEHAKIDNPLRSAIILQSARCSEIQRKSSTLDLARQSCFGSIYMCRLVPLAICLSSVSIGLVARMVVPIACSLSPCTIATPSPRLVGATAARAAAGNLANLPLVQPGTLRWVGAFRPPPAHEAVDVSRAAYGGMGLTYNPARNSLFMVGHDQQLLTAEFTIPTPSTDLAALPSSTYLQKYGDSTDGRRAAVGHNVIGGLLIYNNRLISTSRLDYDAEHVQNKTLRESHYVSGLDLSVPDDARGPFRVGAVKANYVSGYMTSIPQMWQATFGMKALTGWCCGPSIIDRTSYGPAVSAFNPDDLGVLDPVPTITLLYYDSDHMTLGEWSSTKANPVYGMTTEIHGVVFPDGTRSVLFVGRNGLGKPCYGRTTQNAALVGTVDANGVRYCAVGPDGPYGMHAAPYRYQVWAYDALDFVKVKAGTLKPWDPRPYAVWELPVPTASAGIAPRGVAYKQSTGQIFLYQRNGENPYIHTYVYQPTP
jgi:hypothetical protein